MILFHDVDGCLNTADGSPIGYSDAELTSAHRDDLAELGALVNASPVDHLVLNTGRIFEDTRYLCDAIGSDKLKYVLVEHATALWDVHDEKQIDLLDLASTHNLPEVHHAVATIEKVQELVNWYRHEGKALLSARLGLASPIEIEGNQQGNLTIPVPMALDGDNLLETLKQLLEAHHLFEDVAFSYHHSRPERFIDVMGAADKGLGVEMIVRLLGGDIERTAAIGNGLNDLPMLEKVGMPICPANAEVEVLEYCSARGTVSDHGFLVATRSWLTQLTS